MNENSKELTLFESKTIRHEWNAEEQKMYFSVVDVVGVLTESANPTDYFKKLRKRDTELNTFVGTNCPHVEMRSVTGKRKVLAADLEQLFRIIQSIPSPKAEPIKRWLAQVASQRIDQVFDPELSIQQAIADYTRLGYSEKWIKGRIRSIETRNELTDEWQRAGITESKDFAILTNILTEAWSGKTVSEYKQYKGLRKESLRDNMTAVELALNTLAEASTAELSKKRGASGKRQSAQIAQEGGQVAKVAREQLESRLGESVVTPLNARDMGILPAGTNKNIILPADEQ